MYSKIILALGLIFCTTLHAHEMTPTYPKLVPSYVDDVYVAKMKLFNIRDDVEYYEIGVFTKDWKAIPFASSSRIIKVSFSRRKLFEVYIRSVDLPKAVYICTESKVYKSTKQVTLVSSRICSKIEQDE